MGFPTPDEAALAGVHIDAETKVVASAVLDRNAALLLMSPRWPQPDLVLCRQDESGWVEGSSTSGATIWSQTEDDREVGVLVSWGVAQSGESALLVTFHGSPRKCR